MNRKDRRKAKALARSEQIALADIDKRCDIQVDAKQGAIVMVFANAVGRKVVEDLWPDVEWSTDPKFAAVGHSPDWLFTHVKVTKLPAHFEARVPLEFATPDAIGYAVAAALQQHSPKPQSVCHWHGAGEDIGINFYDGAAFRKRDRDLFAEYVPPTSTVAGAG
jgi:hypothetical protein